MKACALLVGLIAISGLVSCVKEVDLAAQKQQENEAEIRKYIADNNLGTPVKDTLGLYVFITRANAGGLRPKAGDSVVVHHVTSTLEGKKIDSTLVLNNRPFKYWYNVNLDNRVLTGFALGLRYMHEGEKAIVLVPSNLAFGSLGDDNYFRPYSPLRFDLDLINVITEEERIDQYVANNQLTGFETKPSGLRFKLNAPVPDSVRADSGKTAYIKYTGKFLNGQQFDSNVSSSSTLNVVVKSGRGVVPGFDEALSLMRKGEKATVIFPSRLGYGANGNRTQNGQYTILPYQPLIFDIEITDVK
jgi:FKBP-type peptidyl-prolyl cis-trans isomerase